MKAITVKYLGPTNFRGSRYKASDGDGNSITVGALSELSCEQNQDRAAIALCEKMNWRGDLVKGWTKDAWVYCFDDDRARVKREAVRE